MDTEHLPPVLTVVQTAAFLGVSRGLAYEAARTGEIPALRIGRRIVVPRDALLARLAGAGSLGAPTDDKERT
jgi:excisionase family DNA binding protein